MATTWPANQQGRVLSGDGAKTLGRDLYDRDQCLFARGTSVFFGEQTTALLVATTVATRYLLFPPWIKSGHVLTVWVQLRGSAANTGYARLYEAASATAGSEQSVSGSTYDRKALTLTIPSNSWASSEKAIEFQLRSGLGGVVGLKCTSLALNLALTDG